MTTETNKPQIVAVLVGADLFSGLQQYLHQRPYGEVANLIQGMGQSPALQQAQLDHLNTFGQAQDDVEEGTADIIEPDEK